MPNAKPRQQEPSFDGDIISVAGSELLTTNSVYHFFVDPVSHQPVQVDQNILAAISKGRFDRRLLEASLAKTGMTKEILEILRHGRIRLNWLINSRGGHMDLTNQLIGISESVQRKDGQVNAYVTSQASSAAAMLFEHTNQRHVLDDSRVFWHAGKLNIAEYKDVNEVDLQKIINGPPSRMSHERYQQREKKGKRKTYPMPDGYQNGVTSLADFLKRTADKKRLARLLEELEKAKSNPANTDQEFEMTGQQLAKTGIAQSHKTTASIQKDLLRKTGVEKTHGMGNDQINLFFQSSAVEESIRRSSGLEMKIEMRRDQQGGIKISMEAVPKTDDQKTIAKAIRDRIRDLLLGQNPS